MSRVISSAIGYLAPSFYLKDRVAPFVASEDLFHSEVFIRNFLIGSKEFDLALEFNRKFLAVANVLDFSETDNKTVRKVLENIRDVFSQGSFQAKVLKFDRLTNKTINLLLRLNPNELKEISIECCSVGVLHKIFSIKSLEKIKCDCDLFSTNLDPYTFNDSDYDLVNDSNKDHCFVHGFDREIDALPNIKFLDLYSIDGNVEIQIDFKTFPNIIGLKADTIRNINFSGIAHNLISLDITSSDDWNREIKIDFNQFPSLKNLRMGIDNQVKLVLLNENGQLENFHCESEDCSWSENFVVENCPFENLRDLTILYCGDIIDHFENSPLEIMRIDNTERYDILENFKNLSKLEIDYEDDEQIEILKKLKIPKIDVHFHSRTNIEDFKSLGDVSFFEYHTIITIKPSE